MVNTPDRLSIITYVSMFYHKFSSDSQIAPLARPGENRKGAVLSLMDGRKTRSMSLSRAGSIVNHYDKVKSNSMKIE